MFLHIKFADGSNPFFFRGTKEAIKREMERWKKYYVILDSVENTDSVWWLVEHKSTYHLKRVYESLGFQPTF